MREKFIALLSDVSAIADSLATALRRRSPETDKAKQEQPHLPDKDTKFAYEYLRDRERYHSHKEKSAYTIFAVEGAFFTALLTTNWYSKIDCKIWNPKFVIVLLILIIWLFVHKLIRWQLINRRLASLQVGTLVTALLDDLKISKDTKCKPSSSVKKKEEQDETKTSFRKIVDEWLWPCYRVTLKSESDIDLEEYPHWYRNRYIELFRKKQEKTRWDEIIPTLGSIFILILSVLYICFIL